MGARERSASPCMHTWDPWVPGSQDHLYLCRCSLWLQVEKRSSSFQLIWKSGLEHRSWACAHTLAKSSGLASPLQLLWSLPRHPVCAGFAWVVWILPTGIVFVFGDDQTSFTSKVFHWKHCNYIVHLGEFKIHRPLKIYLFRSGHQHDKEHWNVS